MTPSESILLVEDEIILSTMLSRFFSKSGYHITCCRDGHEAITLIKNHVFDTIITDIELPGLDGHSLIQLIQQHASNSAIIVISANPEPDNIKQLGFRFISKPFDLNHLLAEVQATAP